MYNFLTVALIIYFEYKADVGGFAFQDAFELNLDS